MGGEEEGGEGVGFLAPSLLPLFRSIDGPPSHLGAFSCSLTGAMNFLTRRKP